MAQSEVLREREQSRKLRVTISDLADELGLTKGTVSRALNNYPDISDSTRLRVHRTAERLGYRPLSHAQAIKTGRVKSLGLILQVNEHDGHRPFLADFLAGVSQGASAQGWTLTLSTAESDADTFQLLTNLAQQQKVDGFILPRTYLDDPRVVALRQAEVPFVLYGRTRDDSGCAWFDIESEAAMRDAVATLDRLGHRRIGFIPGDDGYTFARLRLEGYKAGLSRSDLPFDPQLVGPTALNREDGAASAAHLLRQENPPTALLCAVDRAAIGVYDTAARLGLTIGTDISVISYDGIPEGTLVSPQLSTFSVDTRFAGARLAELLIDRINGTPAPDLRELAQATFLERGSHGPATRTSAELAAHVSQKQ